MRDHEASSSCPCTPCFLTSGVKMRSILPRPVASTWSTGPGLSRAHLVSLFPAFRNGMYACRVSPNEAKPPRSPPSTSVLRPPYAVLLSFDICVSFCFVLILCCLQRSSHGGTAACWRGASTWHRPCTRPASCHSPTLRRTSTAPSRPLRRSWRRSNHSSRHSLTLLYAKEVMATL